MSVPLMTASAGFGLLGALLTIRELRWRRLIRAELPPEIALGIVSRGDYEALQGWRRFRGGWLSGSRERRAFRRFAVRLARAKAAQRRATGETSRLLQVQVLTLRTRLRQIRGEDRPAGESAGDDILSLR